MGASRAMRRIRLAGANSAALAPRRDMSSSLLGRVRWVNVGIAVVVVALLGLVVAWPVLAPAPPALPTDPVAPGGPAPAAPREDAPDRTEAALPARAGASRRHSATVERRTAARKPAARRRRRTRA